MKGAIPTIRVRGHREGVTKMRRAIPLVGVVVLVLALAPPTYATSGTMYIDSDTTLTEDHHGSIEIVADNVTLDCAGHSLIGPSADPWPVDGVLVDHQAGVTVRNCVARGFVNGFKLQAVTGSTWVGNTARGNDGQGFFVADGSTRNLLVDNAALDSGGHGFALWYSPGNRLERNTASGNAENGFSVGDASRSALLGNISIDNGVRGFLIHNSDDNRLERNTASGNAENGFGVVNGAGNDLRRNISSDNGANGFWLVSADGNSILGNRAKSNGTGLAIFESSDNVFTNNQFRGNGPDGWGVWVAESSNDNRFTHNIAKGNDYEGFAVDGSSGNELIRNVSQGSNYQGISLYFGAEHNVVRSNVLTGNAGSGVLVFQSSYNSITDNRSMVNNQDMIENEGGISVIEGSSFNEILRNVACNNGNADAYDDGSGTDNAWEDNVFCTTAFVTPPPCVEPPDHLIGWWPGNDTTDDVIGDRDGDLIGDAQFATGKVASAFAFDGDGDWVDVPDSAEAFNFGTGDFTVDLWVRFNDLSGEQILVEKWVQKFDAPSFGWTITKLDDDHIGFAMESAEQGGSVDTDPLDLATGVWYQFAFVRTSGESLIYMNGELIASNQVAETPIDVDSAATLKFGHRGNPLDTPGSEDERNFYLNGGIDEVEIFDAALTASDIQAIWAAGSSGKCLS